MWASDSWLSPLTARHASAVSDVINLASLSPTHPIGQHWLVASVLTPWLTHEYTVLTPLL